MSPRSVAESRNSSLTPFIERGHRPNAVVHVGGSDGQELEWYHSRGIPVLYFEPHPDAIERARERLQAISVGVTFVQLALGAHAGQLELIIPADGDDEKSSKYSPIPTPGHEWTYVPSGSSIFVQMARFDDWVFRHPAIFRQMRYDTMVIDAQGMELEVLEGCGLYLDFFDYLSVELSATPVYDGEAPASQVIDFLVHRGYRQETEVKEHDDVLFMKSHLLSVKEPT